MFIASASISLRRGSAGRNEVEWLKTCCVPARRTARRGIDDVTINIALLPE